MDEYDTIKSSLNSEIETFVFHILCKVSQSSFRLRHRKSGESEREQDKYTICPSGVPADMKRRQKQNSLSNYLNKCNYPYQFIQVLFFINLI